MYNVFVKKILLVLLLLLAGCEVKEPDYYKLSVGDFNITVGYNNGEYLKAAFDYDTVDLIEANSSAQDIDIYLINNLFGVVDLINNNTFAINPDKAIVSRLTFYVNDVTNKEIKIDDNELDTSIKTNCENFSGKYIEKNGCACVIEKMVEDKHNVIELHGDYLNLDQDQLDHLVIYVD